MGEIAGSSRAKIDVCSLRYAQRLEKIVCLPARLSVCSVFRVSNVHHCARSMTVYLNFCRSAPFKHLFFHPNQETWISNIYIRLRQSELSSYMYERSKNSRHTWRTLLVNETTKITNASGEIFPHPFRSWAKLRDAISYSVVFVFQESYWVVMESIHEIYQAIMK